MSIDGKTFTFYCGGGCGVIWVIFGIICLMSGCSQPGREDQIIIHYLDGDEVLNGPKTKIVSPFRARESRKKVRIARTEYARIQDRLTGDVRIVKGAAHFFMTAYEDLQNKSRMPLLRHNQYMRMYDRMSGNERVIRGPATVIPGAWEEDVEGVQQAVFINADSAAVILNKETGQRKLVTQNGVYYPLAYEHLEEMRPLQRVMSHECIVVRDQHGGFHFYGGTGGSQASSVASVPSSFYLEPFWAQVQMEWSTFSQPEEGGEQSVGRDLIDRIDLRARSTYFQYDLRTVDNVALRVEGSIFWNISDPIALVRMTADPVGDIWYQGRAVLTAIVGQKDLQTFSKFASVIAKDAYKAQISDSFYSVRGLSPSSMTVTKYEVKDEETYSILQEIVEETTARRNKVREQEAANKVDMEGLKADILFEQKREELIKTTAKNDQLIAARDGEAEGTELAFAATTFLAGLNETMDSLDDRVEMFQLLEELAHYRTRMESLAAGGATFFLTPEHLGLELGDG